MRISVGLGCFGGIFAAGLLLCSCVPTVVGGTEGYNVAYVAGELQAAEEVGIDHAWNGTEQALQDLGLVVTSKDKDDLSGSLVARGSEGKTVTVRLERLQSDRTMLRIRVGTFGDQNLSTAILDRIEERLGLRYISPRTK